MRGGSCTNRLAVLSWSVLRESLPCASRRPVVPISIKASHVVGVPKENARAERGEKNIVTECIYMYAQHDMRMAGKQRDKSTSTQQHKIYMYKRHHRIKTINRNYKADISKIHHPNQLKPPNHPPRPSIPNSPSPHKPSPRSCIANQRILPLSVALRQKSYTSKY